MMPHRAFHRVTGGPLQRSAMQKAGSDLSLLELPGQVPRLLGGPVSARVLAAGGDRIAPAGQLQEEQDVEALQEDGIRGVMPSP